MKQANAYAVEVTTTRNTFMVWEIEDYTIAKVAARAAEKLKNIDIQNLEIYKLDEES